MSIRSQNGQPSQYPNSTGSVDRNERNRLAIGPNRVRLLCGGSAFDAHGLAMPQTTFLVTVQLQSRHVLKAGFERKQE